MKRTMPLQSIVDPFVKGIGGELISELVGNDSPPSSADYLFRRHNVIAELKTLQTESFGDPFRRKLGDRMGTGIGTVVCGFLAQPESRANASRRSARRTYLT